MVKQKRTIKNNKRIGKLQFMGVVGQYQSSKMMFFTPSVLKYMAFNGSKFVPKYKAHRRFW
jgi:hypothetical protein